MVKNKWWRPTKKDEKVVGILEEIFRIDWTIGEACSQAGINQSTYHDWIKTDEEFSKRMASAQDYPFILARKTLFKWVEEGDTRSSIEMLKRRDKRYNDKQDITSWWDKITFNVMNFWDKKD